MGAGLKPREAYHMTPFEVSLWVDGHLERLRTADRFVAHLARLVMLPHTGKKTPPVKKLLMLGEPEKPAAEKPAAGAREAEGEGEVVDLEERREALREIIRRRNEGSKR